MKPKPAPDRLATPCRPLQLLAKAAEGVLLRGNGLTVQLTALAPDLFRIRISPGDAPPPDRSWAVERTGWPSHPVEIQGTQGTLELRTPAGVLTWKLSDGSWALHDRAGLAVFTSPAGGTGFSGDTARVDLTLTPGEGCFGLGEGTGPLNQRGRVREFWNTDVLGHAPAIHPGLKSLYVSIPFLLSLREGRAAGLFWDNPRRQTWDLGVNQPDRARLEAQGGGMDLYLFLGPTPAEVVERYTELTGRIPLPPRWALGYQQCRYSYASRRELEGIAREFRRREIPCDVLYLDIHHLDAYRVFTFGPTYRGAPAMLRQLAEAGFKVVAIVDPGVKDDPRFGVLKRGNAARAFVKSADGKSDYVGEVWPGASRFPDFLNARTRTWWGDEQQALQQAGIAGFWNDMNEPANFARPDKTLPPDARHETDHGPALHAEVHNVYGQQMARASQEGARRHRPEQRPYIITRAGYAGIQRYAVVWTGDNSSCWEHLAEAVPMLLNLSLSGVAVCGSDVGGFLDNPTPELFVRWLQFGAFTPFFRNHTNLGTRPQEPWAFGQEIELVAQTWIGVRYQFLPYWTVLLAEARRTGAPPLRPLLWHYPNDPIAVACQDQFLLGRQILVAPVIQPGCVARAVYLPNDVWFDFWSGERHVGGRHLLAEAPLDRMPVYVRAGSILPLVPARQHLDGPADEVITLHVWPGPKGELTWYEDDGRTPAYERGESLTRTITQSTRGRTVRLEFSAEVGDFPGTVRTWQVVVWGVRRAGVARVNGQPIPGKLAEDAGMLVTEVPNSPAAFCFEYTGV
jgi:alpha-glucosidase